MIGGEGGGTSVIGGKVEGASMIVGESGGTSVIGGEVAAPL